MLFTHWSAVFASPQQHELASSADHFTVVRDLSVTALLVGRLLGEIISGLGNSGTFTCTVPSQHADALDLGIDALLLVHVGRPVHRGLRHARGLDPTSLVLIASPVLCSTTIKGCTVVAVRVLVRLGSVVLCRSTQLGSAIMAGWYAPLLLTLRA